LFHASNQHHRGFPSAVASLGFRFRQAHTHELHQAKPDHKTEVEKITKHGPGLNAEVTGAEIRRLAVIRVGRSMGTAVSGDLSASTGDESVGFGVGSLGSWARRYPPSKIGPYKGKRA